MASRLPHTLSSPSFSAGDRVPSRAGSGAQEQESPENPQSPEPAWLRPLEDSRCPEGCCPGTGHTWPPWLGCCLLCQPLPLHSLPPNAPGSPAASASPVPAVPQRCVCPAVPLPGALHATRPDSALLTSFPGNVPKAQIPPCGHQAQSHSAETSLRCLPLLLGRKLLEDRDCGLSMLEPPCLACGNNGGIMRAYHVLDAMFSVLY